VYISGLVREFLSRSLTGGILGAAPPPTSIRERGLQQISSPAAALILATCNAENPPALVAQSLPGLALQKGQVRLTGLFSIPVLGFPFFIGWL